MIKDSEFDISVVILTYNPKWDKLRSTVLSAILQKNVSLEVIVADDGSKESFFDDLDKLFLEYSFVNYTLINSDENRGTVANFYRAIKIAKGEYIRGISPGDYLYSEESLKRWLEYIRKNKVDVCFGNAVYYIDDEEFKIIHHRSVPKLLNLYRKNFFHAARKEYLELDDMALGAAYITKKEIILPYIERMVGKVRLGEDFVYSLMVFDYIQLYFYDEPVVWYEFGHGVSTSNNIIFTNIMKNDWEAIHHLMLAIKPKDKFDFQFQKLIRVYDKIGDNRMLWKLCKMVLFPDILIWKAMMVLYKTYTHYDSDTTFLQMIL